MLAALILLAQEEEDSLPATEDRQFFEDLRRIRDEDDE